MMRIKRLILSLLATATAFAVHAQTAPIQFEDAEVKRICVENWDTNGDGELSYDEAAAVTDLGGVFSDSRLISSFNELQYFTSLATISDKAFYRCDNLSSVVLPSNIVSIGEYSFYSTNISDIVFPNTLENIGPVAFASSKLISLKIPASVKNIHIQAFLYCYQLETIDVDEANEVYESPIGSNAIVEKATKKLMLACKNTIIPGDVEIIGEQSIYASAPSNLVLPNSVREIGSYSIGSYQIVSIELNEGLESIGHYAFDFSSSLSSITIPVSVKSIGYGITAIRSAALKSMKVAEGNAFYDSRDNCNAIIETATNTIVAGCAETVIPSTVISIGQGAFAQQLGIVEVNLPTNVKTIGHYAYGLCRDIRKIVLHKGIESIDENAFYYADKLDTVIVYWREPLTINANVFAYKKETATLFVPYGTKSLYEQAEGWKDFANIVEMAPGPEPEGIERLEYFYDTDPGHGQGTIINNVEEGENQLALSMEGLTPGLHMLFVRSQGSSGVWSATQAHPFYLSSKKSEQVTQLEYFYDTDPGYGQGTLIDNALASGDNALNLSLNGLAPGTHNLFVRALGNAGQWSSVISKPFFLLAATTEDIRHLEYFYDTDPGYGKGTLIGGLERGEQQLALSIDGLSLGAHLLFVRVQDEQGNWSSVMAHPFLIGGKSGFMAMEYYIDTDPGPGQAIPVAMPETSGQFAFDIPTESLSAGEHIIYVRGMDTQGNWSSVNQATFRVTLPELEPCADVAYTYNGRYANLATTTDGATIHYTLDGTEPTVASAVFTETIDVGGLCTLKAVAMKDGMNPSEVTVFDVPCYYDGVTAQVRTAGTLAQAFGWCDAQKIETLAVTGNLDEADLATVRSLAALRHADLKQVAMTNTALPDKAFAGMNLISIELPTGIQTVGQQLFADCVQLAAIGWNASVALTATAMSGVDNPNLLLYAENDALVAQSGIANVVVGGVAKAVRLSDATGNGNFYCMRSFTAQDISYTHRYDMKSGYDSCSGWETLALPFDVQTISHEERGLLTPFASSTGSYSERPFWLCELTTAGWQETPQLKANTPYLIAMPNNEAYSEQYLLAGNVTFASAQVLIPVTEARVASNGSTSFVPTMLAVEASDTVFALNLSAYGEYAEGSVFVAGLRQVRPFEAYRTTSQAGTRYLPIRDDMPTGVAHITMKVDDNNAVYDLQGRKVRSAGQSAGGLRPGIYIQNGRKLNVK